MMHFDDFQIEIRSENFRRFAREPEQRVHAGRIIRRPDDRDFGFELGNLRVFGV